MSFTVSTCDVYHSFDFQRQSGKSTMSKRPFYDLLPTIQCQTPRTVLCRLEDTPGIELRFYFKHQLVVDSIVSFLEFFPDKQDCNPLFDVKEFRNTPFQRVYQYLKLLNEGKSLDNFTFSPRNVDEDQMTCLMLLLRFVACT